MGAMEASHRERPGIRALALVGAAGFEPTTSCSQRCDAPIASGRSGSQPVVNIHDRSRVRFQASQLSTGILKNFATPVLPGNREGATFVPKEHIANGTVGELLTAKEVAARLGVCTATVYKLTASGALRHLRVLNAVRVAKEELERFLVKAQRPGSRSE
jgi:excisionase family DNA binding protein